MPPPQRQNTNRLKKIFILLFLLVLFFLGTTLYFFARLKTDGTSPAAVTESKVAEEPEQVKNAQIVSNDMIQDMVDRVAMHMVLPTDERPTIATVADPAELKGQVFFEKAKKGDIVLIYAKAGKAILYDPVSDRIVEAAPLAVDAPQ